MADLLSKHTNDDRQALQIFKDTLAYDDKNTEVKLYKKKNLFSHLFFSSLKTFAIYFNEKFTDLFANGKIGNEKSKL